MVAPEDLRAALADPYRVACPEGHTALNGAETTASAYCRTCRRSYPATALVDKAAEESESRAGAATRERRSDRRDDG